LIVAVPSLGIGVNLDSIMHQQRLGYEWQILGYTSQSVRN